MANLLNVPVTTAVTAQVGSTFQVRNGPGGTSTVAVTAQGTAAGTGTTVTMQWWLQTSLDGGQTWCDVMSFSHAAAGRAAGAAIRASTAPVAVTDGTMATGSVANLIGNWLRIKYTTTGTWTAGNLRVDVDVAGCALSPSGVGAS